MRERIAEALKDAMKAHDQTRVCTLRLILAAMKDREAAERAEEGEPPEDTTLAIEILSKMVRQREDSARGYEEAGRLELAERERAEIDIIREFLPRPMSGEEMRAAVDQAIRETGADSIRDLGDVMKTLKARHAGRMDFGQVGAEVKARLH